MRAERRLQFHTALALTALLPAALCSSGCSEPRTYTSVAVLPFLDASPSSVDNRHLAEGLREHLAAKLGALEGTRVAPLEETRRFGDPGIPAQSVGEALGVEAILAGTLRVESGKVRVSLALLEAASGWRVRSGDFEDELDRLFALQGAMAREAAGWLKGRLSEQDLQSLGRPPARSVPAWDFYLRGSQAMQADDETSLRLAIARFQKAVELDPDLAEGWLGLGAVHNRLYFGGWGDLDDLGRAESFFSRALQIDPRLTEARTGLILTYSNRGRCEEIIRQGLKAREIGNDVESIIVMANAFLYAGLPGEALPLLETVLTFEPNHRYAHYQRIVAERSRGNHEQVIEKGRRFLEEYSPQGSIEGDVYYYMSQASFILGRLEEAVDYASRAVRIGSSSGVLYEDMAILIFREAGRHDEARTLQDEAFVRINQMVEANPRNIWLGTNLAFLHALAGDTAGLQQIQKALLELAPDDVAAKQTMALSWVIAGELSRGFALMEESQTLGCPTTSMVNQNLYLFENLKETSDWKKMVDGNRRAADRLRALAGLPPGKGNE